jgi:iron complex outermembrane recepter protein
MTSVITPEVRDWTDMKTQSIFSRGRLSASVAPMVLGLAMISMPAFAQTTPAADDEAAVEGETIVVTGSLITNPNLQRSAPVLSTTSDEIDLRQSSTAESLLRQIPGIVPNIGSAVNNGNGGSSFVDLRGLGPNRNIVLLDGSRVVPASLSGIFDLNNVPLAIVDRVDALTGSAVTTYGADAVTGVVNFITKRDFQGAEISVSNSITEKGDGNYLRFDATIGGNFADDKGNVVFSVGYQQSDPVFQGDRKISVNNIDSNSGAPGGSGTTVPSRFTVGAANRVIDPVTGTLNPGFVPFNFNPFNIFQTPFERFNIYGSGRYEVSDGIELYTRGLFSKNTVRTIIAPSGVFASNVTIPVSNPLLPLAASQTLCLANADLDPRPAGRDALGRLIPGQENVLRPTAAQCTAARTAVATTDPNYIQFDTILRRRTVETGPRISEYITNVFDYQVGLRGDVSDNVQFDIGGAYGESENTQTLQGYILTSRIRQALLATNTTTCLTNTAGCVPINVFGAAGSITPAQLAFVSAPSTTVVRNSLAQAHARISGDIGKAIPSANDPVSFAIGTEYRKYRASQLADGPAQIAGELGGAGGAVIPFSGGYDVYEGFGELVVPIVQDKPGFQDLTLEAGVRYSSYKVDAPSSPSYKTTTYKVGGSYTPIDGFKLRGNYSRASRAPNINELFAPQRVGLTNLALDPCAGLAPTTNANLRAICISQGAPAAAIGIIANPTAAQAASSAGGNINLRPERADTYTAGVVIQPKLSFVKNLAISVDYYNITVKKAITSPSSDDVINGCFGTITAASANSAACTGIRRNPVTGSLDGDPATTFGLPQPLTNLGKLKTSGIDVSITYSKDLGFATYTSSLTGNYTFESKFQSVSSTNPQFPVLGINRECVGFFSANCSSPASGGSIQPKFQYTQRSTLSFDDVDVSILYRHIDKVKQEPLDNAVNPAFVGTVPGFNGNFNFGKIKAYDYFDLSTRFSLSDKLSLTVLAENIFNKKPPLVGSTIGATGFNSGNTYPSTYDTLGRKYTIAAKLKF